MSLILTAVLTAFLLIQPQPQPSDMAAGNRDPITDGWPGRSANWVENAPLNRLYHNEGGGLRQVMINTTTPHDGNTYFTVSANVTGVSPFVGMAINSPNTTAIPFIAYRSGPDYTYPGAVHWFDPSGGGSWVLNVNGETVLRALASGDAEFFNDVEADAFDAGAYRFTTPQVEWTWVTPYDAYQTNGSTVFYKIEAPHDATITSLYLVATDNGPGAVNASLYYVEFLPPNLDGQIIPANLIAAVSTTGADPDPRDFGNATVANGLINNANRSYYLAVSLVPDAFGNTSGLQFRGCRVEYTVNGL